MTGQDWVVVFFMAGAAVERLYERRFSHEATRGQVRMRWSYVALHVFHVAIYLSAPIEYFLAQRPANWLLTATGGLLFVGAALVRLQAIQTLGRFWSLHLEIRPDHQLVRAGIYQFVRHPAYAAIMLEMIALPLAVNAYYTFLVSLFIYIPVLLLRWHREEAEMVSKFGEQYLHYRATVPAFIPRFPAKAKTPTEDTKQP
jgi:isoprenylcysteine carboxyl methyltransferase (ICMT) family protein YpbQ